MSDPVEWCLCGQKILRSHKRLKRIIEQRGGGSEMKKEFEWTDNGICLTPCEYVEGVMVGSSNCLTCKCFFGFADRRNQIRCNADKIFKEAEHE